MPTKPARPARPAAAGPGAQPGGVRLLLGPDTGKKGAFVDRVVAAAEARFGATEVLRTFPYDTDLVDLVATLRTPGLFTAHRVVVLQEVQDLRAGAQLDALLAYCRDPAPASTLLLTAGGTARDLLVALPRAVGSARTTMFWEMFENQRQGWLVNYFRARGSVLEPAACALILEMLPANTADLEALCGNLASFLGRGATITVAEIEQYLFHSRQENVFTLFDRVAERDLQGALETVATLLLARSGDAVQIVGVLLSQFQRLTQLKELLAERTAESVAYQKLRISSKRMQHTYRTAHRQYHAAEMAPIQRLLVEFDTRTRLFNQELTEPLLQLLLYHLVVRGGRGGWRQFRV